MIDPDIPSDKKQFRVFLVEDVPDPGQASRRNRTYHFSHSEPGRTLSGIIWRGAKEGRPHTRSASVERAWSENDTLRRLQLHQFICWEFIGLGGEETTK